MTGLLATHQHLLKQAALLLARMDDVIYTRPSAIFLNSAIGGHIRHCLDHYGSLLQGLPGGQVDYDDRLRDPAVETRISEALSRLASILGGLEDLVQNPGLTASGALLVRSGQGPESGGWHPSSPGRELEFLISHTIHHFALIAGLCHVHGIAVASDFGVAPSTLRYRAVCHA